MMALAPGLGHQEEQLGETNIKADAEAQPAELRVKQGDLTPGAQRIRFPEVGAVGDGGVKKVDLAVAGGLSAGPVKDKAGVVQLIPIGLGKAAAHQPRSDWTVRPRRGLARPGRLPGSE